jgi:hypothetical protein
MIQNSGGSASDLKVDALESMDCTAQLDVSYVMDVEQDIVTSNHHQVESRLEDFKKQLPTLQSQMMADMLLNPYTYADAETKIKVLDRVSVVKACSSCNGTGKIQCSSCGGTGKMRCYSCGGKGDWYEDDYVYDNASGGNVRKQVHKHCYSCSNGETSCHSCQGGKIACYHCHGSGDSRKLYDICSKAKIKDKLFRVSGGTDAPEMEGYFSKKGMKFMGKHVAMRHEETVEFPTKENGPVLKFEGEMHAVRVHVQYGSISFEALSVNDIPDIRAFPLAEKLLQEVSEHIKSTADNIANSNKSHIISELGKLVQNPLINRGVTAYREQRTGSMASLEKASDALKMCMYKELDGVTSTDFSKDMTNNLITVIEGSIGHTRGLPVKGKHKKLLQVAIWLLCIVIIIHFI